MAEHVSLYVEEYEPVMKELQSIHPEVCLELKKAVEKIKRMAGESDSVFRSEQVSPKVMQLLEAIEHDLLNNFDEVFSESELAIKTYEEAIMNCDSTCS